MPVDAVHPQYDSESEEWAEIRDVLEGERAVKNAGTKYLPRPPAMLVSEYDAYKQRAEFFGATLRAVGGLAGAIFRKDPIAEVPEGQAEILDNVTLTGVPFAPFSNDIVGEILSMGRVGILTDMALTEGSRPYLRRYRAEDITNWREIVVDGLPVLTLVVLAESAHEPGDDFYSVEEVEQRRVLLLASDPENPGSTPRYTVQVWRKHRVRETQKDEWLMVQEAVPVRAGQPLDFIPFCFIGPTGLQPDVEKSPIGGLKDANISHYRTSADLEHGAHFTALPTPWVSGVSKEEIAGDLRIGSSTAWLLPPEGKAGLLEYQAGGLSALEARLARKEAHMAVLGARLLEDQKRAAEAADTVRMRHSGENSLLASIAGTTSRGLQKALGWAVWWAGAVDTEQTTVALNKDFVGAPLAANELTALVAGWQAAAYPREVLWNVLRRGEIISEDMTDEELADALEREPPLGLSMPFGEDDEDTESDDDE